MRKLLVAAAALAPLAIAGQANADIYVGGLIGGTVENEVEGISLDDGMVYGVIGGWDVQGPFRYEAEIARSEASLTLGGPFDVEIDTLNIGGTVYFDIPVHGGLDVYGGVGGGYLQSEAKVFFGKVEGDGFEYHAAVGGAVAVSPNFTIDAQLRYTDGEQDFDFIDEVESETTSVSIRGRWRIN